MENIINRFLKYISFETTSDENSNTIPSTSSQLKLAEFLRDELKGLGLESEVDEYGYVYGFLKGNDSSKRTIGLIAHMDTAPDMTGKNVNPQIIENYNGEDIKLNDNFTTRVSDFPFLSDLKGHTIITTDGNTLLGADDKSGIAIIMTAISEIISGSGSYGDIRVCFTPDEEIGRGADKFDVKKFGADFAYTIDGGTIGELEYENFNACGVKISIQGKNVHPGSSKNTMVNSQLIAMELNSMLPVFERPEYTEAYEGFFLLTSIEGTVENTKMSYIVRDHSRDKFRSKKSLLINIVEFLNKKYDHRIELEIEDQYYNMKEKIEPHMEIVELAKNAMIKAGVTPKIGPIRGGTDGAKLSFMGLPTPNIFTGGYNFHGRYELLSVDEMKKAVETVINICEIGIK